MHELALCAAIAGIVERRAGGRAVGTVRVRVGELRQVVPDTLTYCWAMVAESTSLAGSTLAVERVAAWIRCDECAVERELGGELLLRCTECGSTAVRVIAGEEFLVASIDVAPAAEAVR